MTSSPNNTWLAQPVDPDPSLDLGYDIVPWEVLPVESGDADQRVLLPTDESMLKQDAFMIVPESLLCALDDHR